MGKWKKIKTAPKDGTMILAFNKTMETYAVVGYRKSWHTDTDWADTWSDVGDENAASTLAFNVGYFTHWMPLPEPPK